MTNSEPHIWNSNTFNIIMKIHIREARIEDSGAIARLFLMAWPVEEFLAMDKSLTEDILAEIVKGYVEAADTVYSYTNTIVAVTTDESGEECIAGAINGYDGALYQKLKKPVVDDLRKRFPSSPNDYGDVVETEAGEYYLDSIGVLPSMRSHGIGSMLFDAILAKVRSLGYSKVGLIVDIDKPKAEALYRRLGFECVGYRDFMGHSMKHMQLNY